MTNVTNNQHIDTGQFITAAIQMVSTDNYEQNLATVKKLIAQASLLGAKLVAIPEFFIRIGENNLHNKDFNSITENIGHGYIQDTLSEIAKENQIYLVAGTIPTKSQNDHAHINDSKTNQPQNTLSKTYNTAIVYAPDGTQICHYNKMHLFRFNDDTQDFDETRNFAAGNNIVTFEANINNHIFKFGLGICYDLRFPELFRQMIQNNPVDAIIIPAAFLPKTGKAHWEILLRARAIENQCYVIGSAQGGKHSNLRETHGHSMIVNPWGEIESIIKHGEGVITSVISKSAITKIRSELPALNNRIIYYSS